MQSWNAKKSLPTPTKLEGWVKRIRHSYGKSMIPEDVMDFLASKIMNVPQEAWGWIETEFPRFYTKCPEVLHVAIIDMWHRWRREHPDKCTIEERDCRNENCHFGWMIWWRRVEIYGQIAELQDGTTAGALNAIAVNCADCRRSGNSVAPAWTYDYCIRRGWIPDSAQIARQARDEISGIREERYSEFLARGRHKTMEARRG